MVKKSKSLVGSMIDTGIGNMIGVGMIGATAGMINELPTGTTKTIVGIVPGLQATSLVAHNVKLISSTSTKKSNSKLKW